MNVRGLTVTAVVSVTPLFVVSGSASFALTDVVTGTMLPPATVESSGVKVSVWPRFKVPKLQPTPDGPGTHAPIERRDGDQVQTVDVTRRVDHHVGRRVRTVIGDADVDGQHRAQNSRIGRITAVSSRSAGGAPQALSST